MTDMRQLINLVESLLAEEVQSFTVSFGSSDPSAEQIFAKLGEIKNYPNTGGSFWVDVESSAAEILKYLDFFNNSGLLEIKVIVDGTFGPVNLFVLQSSEGQEAMKETILACGDDAQNWVVSTVVGNIENTMGNLDDYLEISGVVGGVKFTNYNGGYNFELAALTKMTKVLQLFFKTVTQYPSESALCALVPRAKDPGSPYSVIVKRLSQGNYFDDMDEVEAELQQARAKAESEIRRMRSGPAAIKR